MGDVIMTGPALRALKEHFDCRLTLLTSRVGAIIAPCMADIDDVIVSDLPWARNDKGFSAGDCLALIEKIAQFRFDAAIVFTVYSQTAVPSAMLAYLADIPLRLAYCRENPYGLLTHWVPDKEPYTFIIHQVQRDINLVNSIGAATVSDKLQLHIPENAAASMFAKLDAVGANPEKWILLHPGVSEVRRSYPVQYWIELGRMLHQRFNCPLLLSGVRAEHPLAEEIAKGVGKAEVYNMAGLFSIEEFVCCIQKSLLVITVNTSTVHIAAAMQTPQVVLYAATNPQHTPWKSPASVMYFPVHESLKSKNEVIRYAVGKWDHGATDYPSATTVLKASQKLVTAQTTVV
jgi:ADP-heptose:LPS heptosyltransferase